MGDYTGNGCVLRAGGLIVALILALALGACGEVTSEVAPTQSPVLSTATPTAVLSLVSPQPSPESEESPTAEDPTPTAAPQTSPTQQPPTSTSAPLTATPTPDLPTPAEVAFSPTSTPTASQEPTVQAVQTATPQPTLPPSPPDEPSPTPAELVTGVAPGQGEVAILFNADAFEGSISAILDTLLAHNMHLTFFLTGGYLDRYPEQVRAIEAAGHEIASHGYRHVDYRELTDEQIVAELERWQQRYKEITGKVGPMIWQPPYGYSNSRVRQAAHARGYTMIYWTLDTLDTVGQPKSKQFILDRVLRSPVDLDGAVVLMHVNSEGTVEALPEILGTLQQRGMRAVTVSELLRR